MTRAPCLWALFAAGLVLCCGETDSRRVAEPLRQAAAAASARVGPPKALGTNLKNVMERVHFAFRKDGNGWTGGHTTYATRFDGKLVVEPALSASARVPVSRVEQPFRIDGVQLKRGGATLGPSVPRSVRALDTGGLHVERGVLSNASRTPSGAWSRRSTSVSRCPVREI